MSHERAGGIADNHGLNQNPRVVMTALNLFTRNTATVFLAVLPAFAHAQSPGDLSEIVISGSKEGTPIGKTPATIHTVSAEELQQEKPVFFGDVMNRIPGVLVNNLGAEQHMASFRQPLSTQGVYLYLEDGIALRPVGLYNHNQVYELNLNGIGNVEVIKGPASSIYGSYATGGLMNFLTRAPRKIFGGEVGVQINDQGYKRLDLDVTGGQGDHALRWSAYTFGQSGGYAARSDSDKQSHTLRHDFGLNANTVVRTVFSQSRIYAEQGGTINQALYDEGRVGETPQTFTFRDIEADRFSSSLETSINPGGLSTATLFYRSNRTEQVPTFFQTTATTAPNNVCTGDDTPAGSGAPDLPGVLPGQNASTAGVRCGRTTDVSFQSLGFELKHRQTFHEGRSRWIVGLSHDQGDMAGLEQRYTFNYTPGGPYTGFSGALDNFRDYETAFSSTALFAQLEWAFNEQWLGVLGARHEQVKYDYVRLGPFGAPSQGNTYSEVSPKAGLVYKPSNNLSIYSNLSTGFAPPEISTKYGGGSVGLLDKSSSTSVELGARAVMPALQAEADVAVYRLDLENGSYSNEFSQNYNADTRHEGLELGFSIYPTARWTLRASAAFTEQTVESAPRNNAAVTTVNIGKNTRYSPKETANLMATYAFTERSRLSFEAQHVSDYFTDEANTRIYGGHTLVHARYAHVVGDWEYWVALRNITDKQYAEFASTSFGQAQYNVGAPRTVLVGARYSFGAGR